MTSNAIASLILGTLLRNAVAAEVVAMCASRDVCLADGKRGKVINVFGSDLEKAIDNRNMARDALAALGAVGRMSYYTNRATGERYAFQAVGFANDPFNQIKHYVGTLIVTYRD